MVCGPYYFGLVFPGRTPVFIQRQTGQADISPKCNLALVLSAK